MPRLTLGKPYLLWMLGWLVLILAAAGLAMHSAQQRIAQQLTSQLPALTENSLAGSHGYASLILPQVQIHVQQQLSAWQQQQGIVLVLCQVQLSRVAEGTSGTASLSWQVGLSSFYADYQIRCLPSVPFMLTLMLAMLVLLLLLWRFSRVLPAPLLALQQRFTQQGINPAQQYPLLKQMSANWQPADWQLFQYLEPQLGSRYAVELVQRCCGQQLNASQIAWLLFAAAKYPAQVQQVFEIALGEDELRLQLSSGKVWIRGIELVLSATPMLYYYWYATQRKETEHGWVLNPASNKPNTEYGVQLQQLMALGPGHKKAMSDIEQGAKAKTLDQNRSKIRDELSQQLGPELAEHYLFDCRKDVKTNRFYYRLITAPEQIKLLP